MRFKQHLINTALLFAVASQTALAAPLYSSVADLNNLEARFMTLQKSLGQKIQVGDFVCNTVVVYVDDTGHHGFGVALHDVEEAPFFSQLSDGRFMKNLTDGPAGASLGSGEFNTQRLIAEEANAFANVAESKSIAARAAWEYTPEERSAGCNNPFYLPSVTQLEVAYENIALLNQAILGQGGKRLPQEAWSSTEATRDYAFAVHELGKRHEVSKDQNLPVRPFRNF